MRDLRWLRYVCLPFSCEEEFFEFDSPFQPFPTHLCCSCHSQWTATDFLLTHQVQTGSFLLRLLPFTKPEYGLLSPKLPALLQERAPKFKAWAEKVVAEPSVNFIWDEKSVAERTKARFAKLAAQAKV